LKRVILGLVCGLAMLALIPAAGAGVKISKIYFDSPGSDTGSNSSLKAEWIRLKNTGSTGRSLSGWTIRDTSSHVYRFGTFTLRAGYSVTVHTGSASNTSTNRYWGSGSYIWNNTGDKARLRNASGTAIDACSYSGAGDFVGC
jgi:hypothetical protein